MGLGFLTTAFVIAVSTVFADASQWIGALGNEKKKRFSENKPNPCKVNSTKGKREKKK